MGIQKSPELVEKILDMYADKNISMAKIAKILSINVKTVRKYLKENDSVIRSGKSYSENDEIVLNKDQHEFFDGFILSDGCIYKKGGKNSGICTMLKHKEFAEYIRDSLNLSYIKKVIQRKSGPTYRKKEYVGYHLRSQQNRFFTKEYNRWYINGKKIIPDDFRFGKTSMNILYLCDGTITPKRAISLCTECFEKENLKNTIVRSLNEIGINCYINKRSRICFTVKATVDFLDYIGDCPVKCYDYKWFIKPYLYHKPTKNELKDLYVEQKLSLREVGEKLNLSSAAIANNLKKYKIPRRTLSQAIKLSWESRNKKVEENKGE